MTTMIPNEPVDEVARLVVAAREALTDSMVERLATMGATAFDLLDRLNDDQTRAAVHTLLDRLTEVHKLGALDTLFEVVTLVHAARNAATDNILDRLFTFFEQMINTVGNEETGWLAQNTRTALEEAADEAKGMQPTGGIMSILSMLAKPETQRSLAFLVSFGNKVQESTAAGHRIVAGRFSNSPKA